MKDARTHGPKKRNVQPAGLTPSLRHRNGVNRCLWSVKERLLLRSRPGANYIILPELRTDFPEDCNKYLLMDAESFDYILKVVSPIISKQES